MTQDIQRVFIPTLNIGRGQWILLLTESVRTNTHRSSVFKESGNSARRKKSRRRLPQRAQFLRIKAKSSVVPIWLKTWYSMRMTSEELISSGLYQPRVNSTLTLSEIVASLMDIVRFIVHGTQALRTSTGHSIPTRSVWISATRYTKGISRQETSKIVSMGIVSDTRSDFRNSIFLVNNISCLQNSSR